MQLRIIALFNIIFLLSLDSFAQDSNKNDKILWGCALNLKMKQDKREVIVSRSFIMKGRGTLNCRQIYLSKQNPIIDQKDLNVVHIENNLKEQTHELLESFDPYLRINIPVIATWKNTKHKVSLSSGVINVQLKSFQLSLIKYIEDLFTRYNVVHTVGSIKYGIGLGLARSINKGHQFQLSILTADGLGFQSGISELSIQMIQ